MGGGRLEPPPTAAGLAVFGRRVGLDSLAEGLYVAAVIESNGGWLTAATAAGPLRLPLPEILMLGTFALVVPWWTSHRRAGKVAPEKSTTSEFGVRASMLHT